jgi:1,4-dihydroxy-2-naphthoate octaprenyltransferase
VVDLTRLLSRLIRPGSLLIAVLTYTLGAGIADFLGVSINPMVNLSGLAITLLILLGGQLLDVNFRTLELETHPSLASAVEELKPGLRVSDLRRVSMQMAAVTLTVAALLISLLVINHSLNPAALVVLGTIFLHSFFYAAPPARLAHRASGEVLETIVIANFVPALGFLLQTGEIHRLLWMLTIPLTALMLSMRLAMALPAYGTRFAREQVNMMTSLGWQHGMHLHNALILLAYLLFLLAFTLGLPWRLFWPALLTLPIGLYQIFQMKRIAGGVKPNWNVLNLTSVALVGLSAYLITLSLWIG